MFDLSGKVALVTGASGGIGGAIAEALHGQGAQVALSGRRADALEALAERLGSGRAARCPATSPSATRSPPCPSGRPRRWGSPRSWSTAAASPATASRSA